MTASSLVKWEWQWWLKIGSNVGKKIETQHSGANLPASAKSRNYTSVAAACDFVRVGRQACHQARNVFRLIVLYIRNILKKGHMSPCFTDTCSTRTIKCEEEEALTIPVRTQIPQTCDSRFIEQFREAGAIDRPHCFFAINCWLLKDLSVKWLGFDISSHAQLP